MSFAIVEGRKLDIQARTPSVPELTPDVVQMWPLLIHRAWAINASWDPAT